MAVSNFSRYWIFTDTLIYVLTIFQTHETQRSVQPEISSDNFTILHLTMWEIFVDTSITLIKNALFAVPKNY